MPNDIQTYYTICFFGSVAKGAKTIYASQVSRRASARLSRYGESKIATEVFVELSESEFKLSKYLKNIETCA